MPEVNDELDGLANAPLKFKVILVCSANCDSLQVRSMRSAVVGKVVERTKDQLATNFQSLDLVAPAKGISTHATSSFRAALDLIWLYIGTL